MYTHMIVANANLVQNAIFKNSRRSKMSESNE